MAVFFLLAPSLDGAHNGLLAGAACAPSLFLGLIKRLPTYTEAIGETLGIIPSSTPFDPNTYQA